MKTARRAATLALCDTPAKGARSRSKSPRGGAATPSPNGKQAAAASSAGSFGKKGIMNKVKPSEFQSSTKIEAVLDETRKMMRNDATAKAIIFSQFGAMLELVEYRLKREGISCVVFRGGMSMQARDSALV